ncbi:MAG TPA: hypothetical protein VK502_03910 [Candidatus Saccharimonadales bacterium]|nr:hypothetical protein [Candidatus Saccharimonadales bacterium]
MRTTHNLEPGRPDTSDHIFIWLPGLLDKKEYASNKRLVEDVERELGAHAIILDLYGGDAVKPVAGKKDTHIADWHPSDVFNGIDEIVEQNRGKKFTIGGFSHGAVNALLYAAFDSGVGRNNIDRVVAVEPINFWHWDGYDASLDAKWMLKQYKERGYVDLGTTRLEERPAIDSDPASPAMSLYITRNTITRHTRPFERFPTNTGLPFTITGLHESGILDYVGEETPVLIVNGENNTLTPQAQETAYRIYDDLSHIPGTEFRTLDIEHDYRHTPEQITTVNDEVIRWMQEAA